MNKIALLIPHYNDNNGLIISLASIDSSENVDIVVVDDGSIKSKIDETEVRNSFTGNGNIHFIYLEKNMGIECALNTGLEFIVQKDYKYIARLDTGDTCLKNRFKIQFDFLEQNPIIKLVGSHAKACDTSGNELYNIKVPIGTKEVRNRMYIASAVIHPSIMFSVDVVKEVGYYQMNYKAAEDFAYYFEILKKFEMSNIDDFLIIKELNPNSISTKKRNIQALNRVKIIYHNFYWGYYPIYGLIRNTLIYLTPNNWIIAIKKYLYK